jgi:hypothetical protein
MDSPSCHTQRLRRLSAIRATARPEKSGRSASESRSRRNWVIVASIMEGYEQMVTISRRIGDLRSEKSGAFGPLSHQRSRLILSPTGSWIPGIQRDLALFNLTIDGKLRSCDLVALQVAMSSRATVPVLN